MKRLASTMVSTNNSEIIIFDHASVRIKGVIKSWEGNGKKGCDPPDDNKPLKPASEEIDAPRKESDETEHRRKFR